MHDPVMPVLVKPAVVGWKGKNRHVELTIEREFTGAELVRLMKGWITVDPRKAIEVFEKHGRLKCFDDGELVVEVENDAALSELQRDVKEAFGDQCDVELVGR